MKKGRNVYKVVISALFEVELGYVEISQNCFLIVSVTSILHALLVQWQYIQAVCSSLGISISRQLWSSYCLYCGSVFRQYVSFLVFQLRFSYGVSIAGTAESL